MSDNTIEIELRSVFNKKEFSRIKKFLDENAKSLGQDDKDVYFFLLPDRIAKVVHNISKNTAKIVLKLNRIGKGGSDFDETELAIDPSDFEKAVKIFSNLAFDEIQNSYQERQNYVYKGVELALKYSHSWGYHLELEIVIKNKKHQDQAEEKIRNVASELRVKILTDDELKELAKKIDQGHREGKFNKKV